MFHTLHHKIGEVGNLVRVRWSITLQSHKSIHMHTELVPKQCNINGGYPCVPNGWQVVDSKSRGLTESTANCKWKNKAVTRPNGIYILFSRMPEQMLTFQSSNLVSNYYGRHLILPPFVRTLASNSASASSGQAQNQEKRKDITTVEDPFDAPTYNIPEKPVTFTEGASYTLVILAGLGVAGAAAYGVFKELIFQPREYKIFDKALARVQNDSQVRVRVGSPITGYGQETRNRAARQRIPNRIWTDDQGVEHVEVNFYIRGPHGAGKVYSEMFKDKVDNQWKFMYLIVEIKSPSPAQLLLESYIPA